MTVWDSRWLWASIAVILLGACLMRTTLWAAGLLYLGLAGIWLTLRRMDRR